MRACEVLPHQIRKTFLYGAGFMRAGIVILKREKAKHKPLKELLSKIGCWGIKITLNKDHTVALRSTWCIIEYFPLSSGSAFFPYHSSVICCNVKSSSLILLYHKIEITDRDGDLHKGPKM